MIEIENVSFGYEEGNKTLKDISLSVKRGQYVLLCGKSGCGKTTVTKLVNGLILHFMEKSFFLGKTSATNMDINNTPMYKLVRGC